MTTPFTDDDIVYLGTHLPEAQLRREIHRAEIAATVAENFRGTEYEAPEDNFPFADYSEACKKALRPP